MKYYGKAKWAPLTLEAKLWICEQKQQDNSLTRSQLCELVTRQFKLFRPPALSTITTTLRQHAELSRLALADHDMNMTREAKPKHKEFDQQLRQWVKSFEFCLPDDQIRAQGLQLLTELGCADDLRLGGGWMSSFKRRHKIDKCWHLKGGGKRKRPVSVRDCPGRPHTEGSKR